MLMERSVHHSYVFFSKLRLWVSTCQIQELGTKEEYGTLIPFSEATYQRHQVQGSLGDRYFHRQSPERTLVRLSCLSELRMIFCFSFSPDCLPSLYACVCLRKKPTILSIFKHFPTIHCAGLAPLGEGGTTHWFPLYSGQMGFSNWESNP